ncbi:FlgN protein [Marinobacterium sp. xm-d-420]|uniref:flagellar export chaperone FlgN n=1 Tax=Marinobacterium sp. xm-d-420 TaxID=2497737 RepID=UPI00156979FD|nr:FlgN protein [Marinobacterium sp. xm-d-420]
MANFSEQLNQANSSIDELYSLLQSEFAALTDQDLNRFQEVQPIKLTLLNNIKQFDQHKTRFITEASNPNKSEVSIEKLLSDEQKIAWSHFLSQLKACDELHRKIDQYLSQKIKTTNAILEILQVNKSHSATQLYDEFGTSKLSTIGNKISEA